MSTLVCQVERRLPVAVVAVYGTLDPSSAARLMVVLRDCLAAAPTALIIDASHLVVASEEALRPLISLVVEARTWPNATIAICGVGPLMEKFTQVPVHADIYPDIERATEAALRIPVAPRRTVTLNPVPDAPAQSRQFAQETCRLWGIDRVAGLAELVASELVTNAVIHARTRLDLTLRLADDKLNVAVRDGDPRPMFRGTDNGGRPTDEHGRGLLLLDAMADLWGSSPTADGKVVWATIGLPASRNPGPDRTP